MRKMKKINGYLVVKFNDRELREWEGTALGKYGVIDAELYTGTLEVDRGAMEYDNADSIEEAVELARGLESELDTEEPEVKVTLIKETDEATEEEEVDAQKMIAGWENTLRGQVASPHRRDRGGPHRPGPHAGADDLRAPPPGAQAPPGDGADLHPGAGAGGGLPGQRLPGLPQHLQRGPGAGCRPGQPGRGRRSGARLAEGAPRTGRRAGGDVRRELRRQAVSEGGEIMNGLDLFRSPKTAADEIADIVSAQCPPVVPENCDAFSCRECWLAWLTTGEPPKEKGPSDKQTAPGRDSAPYYPPTEAIRKAAERLKDGNMEYTAIALIRAHDGEELPQP